MPLSARVSARLITFGAVASAATALLGALDMSARVRLVDILALFVGGFGAGAGLVAFLVQRRTHKGAERS